MTYEAIVDSLSPSEGERVRVRGRVVVLNVNVSNYWHGFPYLSTLPAYVYSIQPTGYYVSA